MNLFLITSVCLVCLAINQCERVESNQNATTKSNSNLIGQADWTRLAASLIGMIVDGYAQERNHNAANQRLSAKSSRSHYHAHRRPPHLFEQAESYLDGLFGRRQAPFSYDYDLYEEPADSARTNAPAPLRAHQPRRTHRYKPDSRYYSEADYEDNYANDPHQHQQQVVDAFYAGRDPAPHQDWPLETRDSYLYSASDKHHKHYEVKEISYVYPILLALLILGALFVPFISLFLFLTVSAFNCHQLGSSGFANVTPILGRKRRRRRSVNAVSEQRLPIAVAYNNNENDLRSMFGQALPSDAFDRLERADLITALQLPFALLSDAIRLAPDSDPYYKYDFGLVPPTTRTAITTNNTNTSADTATGAEDSSSARDALLDSLTFADGYIHDDYLKDLMQDESPIGPAVGTELVYWRNKLAQTTVLLRNALVEFGDYI